MCKRLLATCLMVGALVVSSDAFASRARLGVLGTGDPFSTLPRGSIYYDDNHNIFYNPSYVNDFKNWASFERGTAGAQPALATDSEGGFVASVSSFNIGFYMNRVDAINGLGASASTVPYPSGEPTRPFDLMVGGDMGVKWGLGITHAYDKRGTDNTSSDLTLRLGAQLMDIEPFIHFKIKGSDKPSTAADVETKNKSMTFGARYKFGDWTPFLVYRQDKVTPAGAGAVDRKASAWGFGTGHGMKLADNANLHYSVAFWRLTDKIPAASVSKTQIPIDLALEAEMTSWLAARAGLAYNLLGQTDGNTDGGGPTATFGGALKFGKLAMDFVVAGAGGVNSTNFDFANGLFTTASLTYAW